jgi:hypothetical protein
MNIFKKVVFILLATVAGLGNAMENIENPQIAEPAIEQQGSGVFFETVPTLQQIAAINIIKSLVANQQLIPVFEEANIPQELKDISSVASLIACLKNLVAIEDYADLDPFSISFDPEIEQIARDENNQSALDNFDCVRAQTVAVFSSPKLLNLLLLSLNNQYIASFFINYKQIGNILDSIFFRMIFKNKSDVLLSWVNTYPRIKGAVLTILLEKIAQQATILTRDFYRYTLITDPKDNTRYNLAIDSVSQENKAQTESTIKKTIFQSLMFFFNTVTAQDLADYPDFYNDIVAKLYLLPFESYDAVRQIISLLIPKGLNLNTIVGGRDAATYFFGVRGQSMLETAQAFWIAKNKQFLLFLVANGLDITSLQVPPLPLDAPADPVNQAPLAVAQRNYRQITEQDPAFKAALERVQAEYAQKQARQTARQTITESYE